MFLGKTLPLIARVFSVGRLKIVGPSYPVSMPGEVKEPTLVIQNVTCSGPSLLQSASGTELGWALGMMLTETGRIPAERSEQPISTLLFVLLLLLFLFFIVLAVAFACHARQRRRDALLCYKPPMYGSV